MILGLFVNPIFLDERSRVARAPGDKSLLSIMTKRLHQSNSIGLLHRTRESGL